jgi:hypothetical protein
MRAFVDVTSAPPYVNDEPSMTVFTLESISLLLNRVRMTNGRRSGPGARQSHFLRELPPSFARQFTSLGHLLPGAPISPGESIRWAI